MKNELLITNVKRWVAQGKTAQAIAELERADHLDVEAEHEVILLASRYQSFLNEKSTGKLTQEQANVQLTTINAALLNITARLHGMESTVVPRRNKYLKWLAGIASFVGFLAAVASFSGYSLKDIWLKKPATPTQQETPTTKDAPLDRNDSPAEQIPTQPTDRQAVAQPKAAAPGATTTFNGEVKVNGQIITNPTAPITIENNYTTPRDTNQ